MARKRRAIKIYNYECTITGEKFQTTREAANPDELMSVDAYYELNQENDDRPQKVLKEKEQQKEIFDQLQGLSSTDSSSKE